MHLQPGKIDDQIRRVERERAWVLGDGVMVGFRRQIIWRLAWAAYHRSYGEKKLRQ
jgi:hypothetical protein